MRASLVTLTLLVSMLLQLGLAAIPDTMGDSGLFQRWG